MIIEPDLTLEHQLFDRGARVVAGIDEVGRGAWAGPVSVGVVLIDARNVDVPLGVRDSKALSRPARERAIDLIDAWALEAAVGHASHTECDDLGMRIALALATSRALTQLAVRPDALIIDGHMNLLEIGSQRDRVPDHHWYDEPFRFVEPRVRADQTCATVAAASIVAKVTRDGLMRALAPSFPAFDFDANVGYPSPAHQRALRGYGLTPLHRRSWRFTESVPWMRHGRPEESTEAK